ncbi:MAG TPA: hypothetical protein VFE53_17560 [Mucilaginibacter sp.]|jgi:hypothetical protein|nr:hypothetical protein [Mucilaginibacter sp.]
MIYKFYVALINLTFIKFIQMKKNLIFVLLLLSASIFSCNKKSTPPGGSLGDGSNSKKSEDYLQGPCPYDCHDTRCQAYVNGYCGPAGPTTIPVTTNSKNQYDYLGSYHNQGLDFVFSQINSSTKQSYPFIQYQTNIFLASKGYDTTSVNKAFAANPQYYHMPDTANINNPSAFLQSLNGVEEPPMNTNCINYLTKVASTFDTDIGTNAPSSTIYNKFAADIIGIENTAINDATLSSLQLQYVLTAGSIARYSAAYWGNYQLNSSGGGGIQSVNKKHVDDLQTDVAKPKPFSWGSVGKGDVLGAIGGATAGGIAGWIAGPPGAGIGALAGGVGGAVGGSVTSAVGQLFGWL